jgi:hypothetical protein
VATRATFVHVTDDLNAVLAHGMLGNLNVVSSVLSLMANDRIPIDERPKLYEMAKAQIDVMADLLRDMARGLPADVIEFLDQQRANH